MKQYKVEITKEALQDMEDIYNYIAIDLLAPDNAMGQYNRIADEILTLDTFPERFRIMDSEPEKRMELRRMLVDNYSVFYTIRDERVIVTDVLYMASVEYGKENSDVIILLHGGGLSWWNYKEVAERLQTDYHVVLPILDGHAGCDKQFTTIENNALDIIEFVNSKLGGSVLMMGGLSLGGQILLEILSQRKDICKYAIVESVLVIPSKFTYSMIKPAFGSCYGLIKYKWFSKLQFKSLRIKSNLFDEYYKDTCAIRKSDMIAFLQENSVYSLKDGIGECEATVQIYVGEKEKQSMKKSAKIIHEKLQDSFIQVLPNMYHGEFSINHADDYVRKLLEIVKRR